MPKVFIKSVPVKTVDITVIRMGDTVHCIFTGEQMDAVKQRTRQIGSAVRKYYKSHKACLLFKARVQGKRNVPDSGMYHISKHGIFQVFPVNVQTIFSKSLKKHEKIPGKTKKCFTIEHM